MVRPDTKVDKYLVRVHGSRRVTARNRQFLRKFLPLGEKMTEETYRIPPKVDKCDTPRQDPIEQDLSPDPIVHVHTPKTPQQSKMPLPDSSEDLTEGRSDIPEDIPDEVITEKPKPTSPALRRSTRERKRPDFYGDWVQQDKK